MLRVVVSGLIFFNPPTMKAQTRPAETTNPSPKVLCFVFLPSAQTLSYLGKKVFFHISSMSALKCGIRILQKFNLRILMILEWSKISLFLFLPTEHAYGELVLMLCTVTISKNIYALQRKQHCDCINAKIKNSMLSARVDTFPAFQCQPTIQ